jgi:hypothetical protein
MSGSGPRIVRTRKNVSTLGNAGADLFWYEKAVAELQTRPVPDPTSWRYLAAVHGYDPASDPNPTGVPFRSNGLQQPFWNHANTRLGTFCPGTGPASPVLNRLSPPQSSVSAARGIGLFPIGITAIPAHNNQARLLPSAFVNPRDFRDQYDDALSRPSLPLSYRPA